MLGATLAKMGSSMEYILRTMKRKKTICLRLMTQNMGGVLHAKTAQMSALIRKTTRMRTNITKHLKKREQHGALPVRMDRMSA